MAMRRPSEQCQWGWPSRRREDEEEDGAAVEPCLQDILVAVHVGLGLAVEAPDDGEDGDGEGDKEVAEAAARGVCAHGDVGDKGDATRLTCRSQMASCHRGACAAKRSVKYWVRLLRLRGGDGRRRRAAAVDAAVEGVDVAAEEGDQARSRVRTSAREGDARRPAARSMVAVAPELPHWLDAAARPSVSQVVGERNKARTDRRRTRSRPSS